MCSLYIGYLYYVAIYIRIVVLHYIADLHFMQLQA